MIEELLQKMLRGEELSTSERQQIMEYFERLKRNASVIENIVQDADRVDRLSQITSDLGDIVKGRFIAVASTATAIEPTAAGYTGTFISADGEVFNNVRYNIGGVSAGTLGWGANQTGDLMAGQEVVKLNSNGISVKVDATESDLNSYKIIDASGNVIGRFAGNKSSSPDAINFVGITATDATGRNPYAFLSAIAASGQDATAYIGAFETGGSAPNIQLTSADDTVAVSATTLSATGSINASARITSNSFFNLGAINSQTINAGVITVTGGRCVVDTQGGAATDDLDTINGGIDGDLLVIYTADAGRDVTAKDGTGNLSLAGDFVMTSIRDRLTLLKVGTIWVELSRSDNQ